MLLENGWHDSGSEKCSCRRKACIPGNRKIIFPGYSRVFRIMSTPIERSSRNDFIRNTQSLHHRKRFRNEPTLSGILHRREKGREGKETQSACLRASTRLLKLFC